MTIGKKQVDIRENNKSAVIDLMLQREMTLADMEKQLRLSHTALNKVIKELMESGVVLLKGQRNAEMGRPSALYDVNPDCGVAAAIYLDGRKIEIYLVDMKGFEINRWRGSYGFLSFDETLCYVAAKFSELKKHYRTENKPIKTVAVSLPSCGLFGACAEDWEAGLRREIDCSEETDFTVKREFEFICIEERKYGYLKHYEDNAVILNLENRVSVALYSKGSAYSAWRTKDGNLNSLLDYDFFDRAATSSGVPRDLLAAKYSAGDPAAVRGVEETARPVLGMLKQLVYLFDAPLVIVCGEATEYGEAFQLMFRSAIAAGGEYEVEFVSFDDKSPACAGAVWLATYDSLKKIIMRS